MLSDWRKSLIAHLLLRDGVIAYPTEGVWGLGCLPGSLAGTKRILSLKRRSWRAGLLLVAADIEQFEPYLVGLDEKYRQELEVNWPGPITYLVPDNGTAPAWIVGQHSTLGLRVSNHPIVRQLCQRVGPLVSTSANITSRPSALSALKVRQYFGDAVDHVVPGHLGRQVGPSTIRMLESGETLR